VHRVGDGGRFSQHCAAVGCRGGRKIASTNLINLIWPSSGSRAKRVTSFVLFLHYLRTMKWGQTGLLRLYLPTYSNLPAALRPADWCGHPRETSLALPIHSPVPRQSQVTHGAC
jgi:hypothetical protein